MWRTFLAILIVATSGSITFTKVAEEEVVFSSATECQGEYGVYRWDVKTDHEAPPDTIPEVNKGKPSDIGKWPEPRGIITKHTPRSSREKEWFAITGKVTLVKAEADGDLHIQIVDSDGSSTVNVIVEVRGKTALGESPWSNIRTEVFGWTNTTSRFSTTSNKKLDLMKRRSFK